MNLSPQLCFSFSAWCFLVNICWIFFTKVYFELNANGGHFKFNTSKGRVGGFDVSYVIRFCAPRPTYFCFSDVLFVWLSRLFVLSHVYIGPLTRPEWYLHCARKRSECCATFFSCACSVCFCCLSVSHFVRVTFSFVGANCRAPVLFMTQVPHLSANV